MPSRIERITRKSGNAVFGGDYDLVTLDGGINISVTMDTEDFVKIDWTINDGGQHEVKDDSGRVWLFREASGFNGWNAVCRDGLTGQIDVDGEMIDAFLLREDLIEE